MTVNSLVWRRVQTWKAGHASIDFCDISHISHTLREAMSGGGSRASASALTSGMPLAWGDPTMSSSCNPMLASEMDLGMGVNFNGVTDMGSAAQPSDRIKYCSAKEKERRDKKGEKKESTPYKRRPSIAQQTSHKVLLLKSAIVRASLPLGQIRHSQSLGSRHDQREGFRLMLSVSSDEGHKHP